MIKIILSIIGLVLVGLFIYSYTSTNENKRIPYIQNVEKELSSTEKIIVKEYKRETKITPIQKKVVKQKIQPESKSKKEVQENKGIIQTTGRTFETIEELEEASGLTDTSSDDDTPMELEKVILED